MTKPMLPPPPSEEPDVPPLVEWDPSSAVYSAVPREMADTWKPTGFESDSPEAIE